MGTRQKIQCTIQYINDLPASMMFELTIKAYLNCEPSQLNKCFVQGEKDIRAEFTEKPELWL